MIVVTKTEYTLDSQNLVTKMESDLYGFRVRIEGAYAEDSISLNSPEEVIELAKALLATVATSEDMPPRTTLVPVHDLLVAVGLLRYLADQDCAMVRMQAFQEVIDMLERAKEKAEKAHEMAKLDKLVTV